MKNFFQKLFQPKTSNSDKNTKEPTKLTELVEDKSEPNVEATTSHYYGGPGAESIAQITLDYRGRAKLHGQ